MDPDIKQRFDTLDGAMAALAAAQAQTEKRIGTLAAAQAQTEKRIGTLAAAQAQTEKRVGTLAAQLGTLAAAQAGTDKRLRILGERVDWLAQLMIRGYTEAAKRHGTIIARLDRATAGHPHPGLESKRR